ncbi:hypothetical protein RDMS_01680 [Deinococcus sp. RL]|nr:hypothetical protein RDMS_01680 [Deinococcus sp. RL]
MQLIDHLGSDKRVVDSARVSLAGDGEAWRELEDPRLIRYMLRHGHWSPFEHCTVTLMLKVPLFLRSQIMRHRSMAFNEVSARYTEVPDEFYVPGEFRAQASSNRQASVEAAGRIDQGTCHAFYADAIKEAASVYRRLLEEGVAREQARAVLPQAMYTRFYASGSLRSWLHFLEARDHPGAQWEAQQVAQAVAGILEPLYPVTFAQWRALRGTAS